MNYSRTATLEPTVNKPSTSQRIELLDVLRGIVLFGILIIHSYNDFRSILYLYGDPENQNDTFFLVKFVMNNLFSNLLYTVFSFLFGLSVAIQLKNASSKGQSFSVRFLWRLTILLVIGFIHSIWFQRDILQLYALLGMMLLIFRGVRNNILVLAGIFLTLAGLSMSLFHSEIAEDVNNLGEWSRDLVIMRTIGLSKIDYLILSGRLFVIFSLFVWGLYAGKKEIFNRTKKNKDFFTMLLFISFGLTLFMGIIHYACKNSNLEAPDLINALSAAKRLAQSAFYVSLFVKLYELKVFKRIGELFVPVGKMGLTIYVTQSIFLVYYYSLDPEIIMGFGLQGAMAGTLAYFIFQLAFAHTWMSAFNYGPLEWLWRSLTYFKRFPIVKADRLK